MADLPINASISSVPFVISIIIVNWNTKELLANCLDSIFRATNTAAGEHIVETIVVDNASSDGSQQMLQERFPQVELIQNSQNIGFARANNQGLAQASGAYLLLLNSDTLLPPDALEKAIHLMAQLPEAGVAGVTLLNPDGSFQASYADFPTLKSELLTATGLGTRTISPFYPSPRPQANETTREVDWVAGAFMLVRRAAYAQVGGLDERYHMYSEETDWCFRFRKQGWKIVYLPEVHITHIGGASTRQRRAEMVAQLNRSKIQFFAANYGATRAAQLRVLLGAIFFIRHIASRSLSLVLPKPAAAKWRAKSDVERLVRDACLQVNF